MESVKNDPNSTLSCRCCSVLPTAQIDPLPEFVSHLAHFGAGQAIRLAFACAEELVATSFSSAKYPLAIKVLLAARMVAAKVRQPLPLLSALLASAEP